MKITIINNNSGLEKECTFVDFGAKGAWAEMRYPGPAGGLYSFSLVHGGIECKRSEHPLWRLSDEGLTALRAMAKDKGIKYSPKPKQPKNKPTQRAKTNWRQTEMFAK